MPALLGVGTIFNGTEETIGIAQVLYKIGTLVGAWFLKSDYIGALIANHVDAGLPAGSPCIFSSIDFIGVAEIV